MLGNFIHTFEVLALKSVIFSPVAKHKPFLLQNKKIIIIIYLLNEEPRIQFFLSSRSAY